MSVHEGRCLFCGTAPAVPVLRRPSPRHVICRVCGLVYQSPQPTEAELAKHYAEGYWEGRADFDPTKNERSRDLARWISEAGGMGPDSLVVEVGCGLGHNLTAFREVLGCRTWGLEPSGREVKRAVERGLDVRVGNLGDVDPPSAASVVVLCHVLEHLADPIASLRLCASWLAPAGFLLIEVPSPAKTNPGKDPRRWFSMEHLWYFMPSTLARCCAAAGLGVARSEVVASGIRVIASPSVPSRDEGWPNEFAVVRRLIQEYRIRNLGVRLSRKIGRLLKGRR